MRFSGYQSADDYSIVEEDIANGILYYLEDIMEDRGDQLVRAFSEEIRMLFRSLCVRTPQVTIQRFNVMI
ncbi:hypothetical protein L596_025007 [Steinernema carpocapsae]|uniref:Uncharacterized protein n=1 Tax=Steinernema carpocapsae TaxID=34508 RepID=A0A4U5M6K4_STECR|nr:hypothetical protein L596_025007 [Steinernema carpocapsae]